jgi:hypothetical protein
VSHGIREDDEPLRGSQEIADRLTRIFLPDAQGKRPVYGGIDKFQSDPYWRDHILFYEYFHGDNGAGLGASHQTGWTGVVAKLIQLFGLLDAKKLLEAGKQTAFIREKTKGEVEKRKRGRAALSSQAKDDDA